MDTIFLLTEEKKQVKQLNHKIGFYWSDLKVEVACVIVYFVYDVIDLRLS